MFKEFYLDASNLNSFLKVYNKIFNNFVSTSEQFADALAGIMYAYIWNAFTLPLNLLHHNHFSNYVMGRWFRAPDLRPSVSLNYIQWPEN